MPRQMRSVKRQAALGGPHTLGACTCERSTVVLRVVRCVERGFRVALKTLQAVPGHVLDGEERSVGREQEVEVA